jgi:hypothetical protein
MVPAIKRRNNKSYAWELGERDGLGLVGGLALGKLETEAGTLDVGIWGICRSLKFATPVFVPHFD